MRSGTGLRARLSLWTAAVMATAFAVGFAWVHLGLRSVLEAKNDAFLVQKTAELLAVARDSDSGLDAEIGREVEAYEEEGLIVVVRRPDATIVAPAGDEARRLADRLVLIADGPAPITLAGERGQPGHRVLRSPLDPGRKNPATRLDLALSLAATEATLAQFDRRVAAGGLAFLAMAVAGGFWLARQALRPVARSVATARRLEPDDLTARLPLTGSRDELDQLAATINDLLDRLAANHAQAARFTADASHELRGPLSAMRAAVDVALQRPREADDYRDVLISLGEQCDRLTALVNGLLLLARADSGQVDLLREPVDLASLVEEVAEMYQPLAEESGVSLVWKAPSTIVSGDASRLRQLFTNLLDNAIKFTDPGGVVTVEVARSGKGARVVVSDTGVGIPRERLAHVFDRFYQADPSRSSGGTGLGLSISRWIAEAHGGTVRAESDEGRGSRFSVELPLA